MTTNSGSIPPLFCSTPPPDDNFVDTQLDEEDFDDEYQRNQISAQTPEFSKDVVIEKMSTFSLCDDDDIVEYNYLKIPFSKETDDDNPLDFIIQEIKTIDNDLETDETKVQHFNAQFDEGPNEISDQFTDDDFGVFQSRSQFEDVLHAQDDSSIDKIQTGEEKLHDLSSQEDEEAALQNGVQTSSSNTPYDSIVHQEIEDIQTNIEDIEHKVKDIIPKDEENENKVQNNSNLDDFDDFQSISISKNNISTIVKLPMEEPQAVQFEADFNQFSAFEDNNDTQIKSEEVEDEFDDFQDFTSAPALKSQDSELFPPYVPDTTNISERITSIIKIMFPEDSTPAENVEPVVKLGPSSMIINPVDSALALEFQWNKSEMRHFLMKSIGIDIRGADLHENWNPSMPRFAANLGAVPLEPLKPVKTDISQANPMPINEATNLQVVDPAKVSDIPVVEFNLNRFSTDNPLDGSKESNNSKQTEEIYSTQLSKSINEQPEQELQITDTSIATQFGPPISKSIPTATSIIAKQQVKPEAELNNDFGLTVGLEHEDPAAATSTTYSGAFKETHIFTPAKIESITRSQAKTKSPIDFDFETAAAGIIIDEKVINKEYRDVEYKPPTPPPKSQPASVLTIDDDFSDFQSVSVVHAKQPVIGQKVKELESRTSTPNDMILSPAVLLPQSVRLEKHKNSKIEWPEPGLNSDEMARFEQIFSKPIEGSSIEEDEWCDFVSNTESMPHITPSANTYQDDEWSEFVSSAPATAQPQFNSGAWQNANYYNNPLSVYSSTHSNFVPNENNNNISMIMGSTPNYKHSQSQDQTQAATLNKNQFLNYNKVVPSISLIPDLGFVAPPTVSSGRFLNNFQNSNIPRQ